MLGFHLLGGSSVGHVEGLAEFSVAVFLFSPFPEARSDLSMKKVRLGTFLQQRQTHVPPHQDIGTALFVCLKTPRPVSLFAILLLQDAEAVSTGEARVLDLPTADGAEREGRRFSSNGQLHSGVKLKGYEPTVPCPPHAFLIIFPLRALFHLSHWPSWK